MTALAIGSVSVDVVPNAEGFWREFVARTQPGAAEAGRKLGRDIRVGMQGELAKDIKVGVKADTRQARSEIAALRQSGDRDSGALVKNLLALAPALVPLGAAAAAAGAELAVLGVAGVLAVTGIKNELNSATPNGAAFAGVVRQMKGDLSELQSVASRGVLTGFRDSTSKLQAEMPQLNEIIARQSVLLGSTLSHVVGGLVGGFKTFAPLLDQVGQSVDRVARRFESFATGSSGQGLGKVLAEDYAKVAPIIDDIATAIGHIIAASHGVGLGILTDLGILAKVISSFPIPVLQGIILGFVAFRAAAAIQGVASAVAASFAAMSARVSLYGLQNQLAAAQATEANATIAASAAASAASQAAAAESVAAANLAQVEAIAASTAAADGSYTGRAAAAVASAEAQVAAAALASQAAIANAEVTTAASAQAATAVQAASARIAVAQKTAATGFASALGPIGLVAAGLLILPSLFDNSSDGADKAASSLQTYSQALQESNGAINDSVRSSVAKALADTDAFDRAHELGISQQQLTTAVVQGGTALTGVEKKITDYALAHKGAARETLLLGVALQEERQNFVDAKKAAADQEAALLGVGSATGVLGQALTNGGTDLRLYVAAVKEFNSSADTAADRGKLIGEALRAANGDAISYQNTLNATAKANQQLVTDFVNLKKGILDLKTGTLDYHNAAAGPVLSDLQSLQDANVKAAAAVYQHFVNTEGGAKAAGNAFDVYKRNTQGALTTIGSKLGLTGKALTNFKNEYFGIKNAGDLKKRIELLGTDKIEAALKGILEDLDILAGKRPLVTVNADGKPAHHTIAGIELAIHDIKQGSVPGIDLNTADGREKLRRLQNELYLLRAPAVVVPIIPDFSRLPSNYRSPTGAKTGGGPNGDGTTPHRARGGEINGAGTGTSDSILARVSNGEFVVKASAYKRNKGLVRAINAGAPGFASGGEVGGYSGVDYSGNAGNGASRSKGSSSSRSSSSGSSSSRTARNIDYVVAGSKYDTLAQARSAAQKLFNGQIHLGLVIDAHELVAFRKSLKGTAADARAAFGKVYQDLRKLGLSDRTAKMLRAENTQLDKEITRRNAIADRLQATREKYFALSAEVKSAITGSFDITSAGTGFDGQQPVTGLNILAQSKQAEARVKLFVKDIKALKGKINGTYLRQLATQGPDALPQAEALLKLKPADLKALNASQASIAAQGAGLGKFTAETFYRSTIDTQRRAVQNENKKIDHLADRIVDQVKRATNILEHRAVIITADGREIARVVNQANSRSGRRS